MLICQALTSWSSTDRYLLKHVETHLPIAIIILSDAPRRKRVCAPPLLREIPLNSSLLSPILSNKSRSLSIVPFWVILLPFLSIKRGVSADDAGLAVRKALTAVTGQQLVRVLKNFSATPFLSVS